MDIRIFLLFFLDGIGEEDCEEQVEFDEGDENWMWVVFELEGVDGLWKRRFFNGWWVEDEQKFI